MGNCMSSKAALSPTTRGFRDKPTLSMSSDFGVQHSSIQYDSSRDVNELIRDLPDTADVKTLSSIALMSNRGRQRGSSAVSLLSNEDNANFKLNDAKSMSYDHGALSSLSEHGASETESTHRSRNNSYMSFVDPLNSITQAENNLELLRQIQAQFPVNNGVEASESIAPKSIHQRPKSPIVSNSPRSSSETDADSSSFSSTKDQEAHARQQSVGKDPFFVIDGDDMPMMTDREKEEYARRSSCYIVESRDSNATPRSERSSQSYSPRSSTGFSITKPQPPPVDDLPSFVSPKGGHPVLTSKVSPVASHDRMSYESHYSLMSFSQSFSMDKGSFDFGYTSNYRDTSCSRTSMDSSASSEPGLYL
ncbi:hypothetical protein THRCLA_05828 [Thraustotheca clavata]|uniref:Uncharacterized protein n=1 Tax=Thraustotheca clavata TaxID=74557 RepID=A0A1V9ZS55_9STRA|nr:hypothetical protein THRCLA_05828 [Thraustotheca clavata]